MTTVELRVEGMHCQSCSALIEETLAETSGVERASVDLEGAFAVIDYDEAVLSVPELCATIVEIGYTATPMEEHGAAS